jgi:glyoxylase-like metal-dependent hydrolase (beta-lactamase superfamily II)
VEIIGLLDVGPGARDPSAMFPQGTPDVWARYKEYMTPDGKYPTNNSCFFVRTPQHKMLVDTALGKGPHANAGGVMGKMLDALKEKAGIGPEEIDLVLITHLHGDHIGWNVDYSGDAPRPTFPKAKYIIPEGDWDYYTKSPEPPLERRHAVERQMAPLVFQMNLVEFVQGERQITPEVTTVPTPGHTPGHQCFYIQSGGQRAMLTGDLFHSPMQVEHPEWNMGADVDKPTAAKSRTAMMNRFAKERFNAVCAPHIVVGKNIGQVIELEGRRMWQVV